MAHIAVFFLYVTASALALAVSLYLSPLGEDAGACVPETLRVSEVGILAAGKERAAEAIIAAMLIRGMATMDVGFYKIVISDCGPLLAELGVKTYRPSGAIDRLALLGGLTRDLDEVKQSLLARGFIHPLGRFARDDAWMTLPLVMNTALGIFLVSMYGKPIWPDQGLLICFWLNGAVLIFLVTECRLPLDGRSALQRVRRTYDETHEPPLDLGVALYGPKRLSGTIYFEYLDLMARDTPPD